MSELTLHCGACGRPTRACTCGVDHYPWNETERANLLSDICAALGAAGVPALAPPPPPAKPRPPIVTRYGVDFCSSCSLMLEYCRCGERLLDSPSKDARAESDLERRIREVRS
jgi:hypothetical protein